MTAQSDRDPHEALVEEVARAFCDTFLREANSAEKHWTDERARRCWIWCSRYVLALIAERTKVATERMNIAAQEWSREKYGKPIGNDALQGCWSTMHATSALWPKKEGK